MGSGGPNFQIIKKASAFRPHLSPFFFNFELEPQSTSLNKTWLANIQAFISGVQLIHLYGRPLLQTHYPRSRSLAQLERFFSGNKVSDGEHSTRQVRVRFHTVITSGVFKLSSALPLERKPLFVSEEESAKSQTEASTYIHSLFSEKLLFLQFPLCISSVQNKDPFMRCNLKQNVVYLNVQFSIYQKLVL